MHFIPNQGFCTTPSNSGNAYRLLSPTPAPGHGRGEIHFHSFNCIVFPFLLSGPPEIDNVFKMENTYDNRQWGVNVLSHLCCAVVLCAALCKTSSGCRLPAPTPILLAGRKHLRSLPMRKQEGGKRSSIDCISWLSLQTLPDCSFILLPVHSLCSSLRPL